MAGDGFRRRHDHIKWCLDAMLDYAEIEHITEVMGLFVTSIKQEATGAWSQQQRQGMVPDFAVTPRNNGPQELWELKTISQSTQYFGHVGTARCSGVGKRAGTIHGEYVRKAMMVDRDINGDDVTGGRLGRMGKRLAEFGQVRGIAVGPRGEMSGDAHKLVDTIATRASERKWRRMGARNPIEARAIVKNFVTRKIGIVAVRANAAMLVDRLGILQGDGSSASKRRKTAKGADKWAEEEYEAYFARGQGGHGGGRPRQ